MEEENYADAPAIFLAVVFAWTLENIFGGVVFLKYVPWKMVWKCMTIYFAFSKWVLTILCIRASGLENSFYISEIMSIIFDNSCLFFQVNFLHIVFNVLY